MNAKTQVIADANPVGLGAVLAQKQGEDYKNYLLREPFIVGYPTQILSNGERSVRLSLGL